MQSGCRLKRPEVDQSTGTSRVSPVCPSFCFQVGDNVILRVLRSGEGGESGMKELDIMVKLRDEQ